MTNPLARAAAVFAIMVAIALASFIITRQTRSDGVVVAQVPQAEPFWHVPILDADDELARFDGTLNGIRMGPQIAHDDPESPCARAGGGVISLEEAAAGDLNVVPAGLPSNASLGEWHAVQCGGVAASADATYFLPPDLDAGFRGAVLDIFRRRGGFAVRGSYPADRVQPTVLAGRPGLEVRPVLSDGLGSSAIVLREEWGLTIVRGEGLTLDALREATLSLFDHVGGRE